MDQLLRAIGNKSLSFGGKIEVLGGNILQCLPVQVRAIKSKLWICPSQKATFVAISKPFLLTKNIRVDSDLQEFMEYLIQVGNGELPTNSMDEIEFPGDIPSNGNLIEDV